MRPLLNDKCWTGLAFLHVGFTPHPRRDLEVLSPPMRAIGTSEILS